MKKIVLLISAIVFSISVFDEPLFLKNVKTDLSNSIGFNNNLSNTFFVAYIAIRQSAYVWEVITHILRINPAKLSSIK